MLPGKKYTPEDVVHIGWRRKWLIVVPFVLIALGTYTYTRRMPDLYRSETLILVVPQRVPDTYVKSTVTARIEDRLPTIQQQILTRSRLERIITDLNLYPEQRATAIMEDLVDQMRGDIAVTITGDSFRVSYVNPNPRVAQQVASRLASLFIEENLRDRENQAESTNEFLDAQLDDAKRRLIEHEKRLEEYRRRYAGELPSQLASNLQVIQSTQMQLQTLAESINRERERRLLLERQLADLEQEPMLTVSAADGAATAPTTTQQQLQTARRNLEVFESRFTADHPDVRAMKRTIAELEARLDAEQRNPRSPEADKPLTPAEALRRRRVRDLQAELAAVDGQLAQKTAEDNRLRRVIAQYQSNIDAVPTRESELVELTRDYATLQNTYAALAAKREDSLIAANLERRQIGEQFKVLDPAGVPEKPFSPNRLLLNSVGAGAGLGFGLLLIALLEYRDSTFKTDDEVRRCLNLPVLAVIPVMMSPVEARRVRRRRHLALASGMLLVAVGGAVAYWRLNF